MSKYSSYKEHQLITENWRKFINEASDNEPVPGLRGASFDTSTGSEEFAPDPPPSTGSLASRLWDILGTVGSIAAGLVVGPTKIRPSGQGRPYVDPTLEHRNPAPLTEGEGPPKAFEQWSQMFPKAGEALLAILDALGKDTLDTDMGVDTRGDVEMEKSGPGSYTKSGEGHKFQEE
jgi:hypothetical protein